MVAVDDRLGEPGSDVSLVSNPRRPQLVEAKAADDDQKPSTFVFNRVEVGAEQACESFLHHVLCIAVAAEQPVGDVEQKSVVLCPRLVET